jgi:hypothetical protein
MGITDCNVLLKEINNSNLKIIDRIQPYSTIMIVYKLKRFNNIDLQIFLNDDDLKNNILKNIDIIDNITNNISLQQIYIVNKLSENDKNTCVNLNNLKALKQFSNKYNNLSIIDDQDTELIYNLICGYLKKSNKLYYKQFKIYNISEIVYDYNGFLIYKKFNIDICNILVNMLKYNNDFNKFKNDLIANSIRVM